MWVRISLVFIFPMAIGWAFLLRLWIETKDIPFYVRNDLVGEWRYAKNCWRTKSLRTDDHRALD